MPKGNFNRYSIGCGVLNINDFALDVAEVKAPKSGDAQIRNQIVRKFVNRLRKLGNIKKSSDVQIVFNELVIKRSQK